jgi:hypothetical protein
VRKSRSIAVVIGAIVATMTFAGMAFGASQVVVTDANAADHGWMAQHSTCGVPISTGSQVMEEGPANPPLGNGSREFRIGPDGNSFETFRLNTFNGTLLSDLTELSYWTYVESGGSGGQAPYLNLIVDWNNDGLMDDQLFFEPVYQTGDYSGDEVPDQGDIVVGDWQDWDALNGGWWALSALTFGPPLVTLETYIAAHPTAELLMPLTQLGSVRIATGCGGLAWANFVGNADAFTIGAGDISFTYNFEVTNEPENADACKRGGWRDLTDAEGEPFRNQGDCVRYANTGS